MSRPLVAVTLGDPAGIGPEIARRLLAQPPSGVRLLMVGDPERVAGTAEVLPIVDSPEAAREGGFDRALLSACRSVPDVAVGEISAEAGAASYAWVEQAASYALEGRVDAIATGPIHKEAWNAAGIEVPGHTEALRDLAGVDRVLMLLVGGALRAALATIHVPLASVSGRLDTAELTADLELLSREIASRYGPDRPRIAVCGLNPHAGEGGLFGSEDAGIIAPAVEAAKAAGVDAHGPLPADACIPSAVRGGYDAVFAMYHDQALPTVKAIAPRRAVNVTLGLPFIRTSVDHGTAFDIAGQGKADPSSLVAAVEAARDMARRLETSA